MGMGEAIGTDIDIVNRPLPPRAEALGPVRVILMIATILVCRPSGATTIMDPVGDAPAAFDVSAISGRFDDDTIFFHIARGDPMVPAAGQLALGLGLPPDLAETHEERVLVGVTQILDITNFMFVEVFTIRAPWWVSVPSGEFFETGGQGPHHIAPGLADEPVALVPVVEVEEGWNVEVPRALLGGVGRVEFAATVGAKALVP